MDGYVFYLNLSKLVDIDYYVHHKIVLISGFSDEFKYLIIFPCINEKKFMKNLEDLLEYINKKIDDDFIFSGDYVLNIGISMADIHYALLYVAMNNIETEEDMSNFLESIDVLYLEYEKFS